jgi:hypothetical protein
MLKGKSSIFFIISCCLSGLFPGLMYSQSRSWSVYDLEGNRRFSVMGDTLVSMGADQFLVRCGKQDFLFQGNPFQEVKTVQQQQIQSLGIQEWLSKEDGFFRIFPAGEFPRPLPFRFREVGRWRQHLVGWTDSRCILDPGTPGEVVADSVWSSKDVLHLFVSSGLVVVPASGQPRHHPVSGRVLEISPFQQYYRVDTTWFSFSGSGNLPARNGQLWWNDTIVVDSVRGKWQYRSPSQKAVLLGDSVAILNPNFLVSRSKSGLFLHSPGKKKRLLGRPLAIKPVADTLLAIQTKKQWELWGISGSRFPVNKAVQEVGILTDGLLKARSGKRVGFIDAMGFIRIACRYDSLLPFQQGLAAARIGMVWGFLDKDERIKIQPHFEEVASFINEVAAVKKEGKWGLIRPDGNFIQSCQFDFLENKAGLGWKYRKGSWMGWLDPKGKSLLPNRYTDIIEAGSGYFRTLRDSKCGLFSPEGKQILPPDYQVIIVNSDTQNLITSP